MSLHSGSQDWDHSRRAVLMGVDIGQKRDRTAICVVEQEDREDSGSREYHYVVRHLERLAMRTPYPEAAKRVAEVADHVRAMTGSRTELFVDATGIGMPIVDLLDQAPSVDPTWAVYFTHGDRRTEETKEGRRVVILGKAYLVSRLQMLLQCQRLHLPTTSEARVLADELREYEIRVEADANEHYGAFQVGTRDDLVTALGLAVQDRKQVYSAVIRRR